MQVGVDSQISATAASAQADRLTQAVEGLARDAQAGGAEARNVPHEFSKLLATMLVKEMRQALPQGFFGEGPGSDIFDGWLDDHLGSALAARDGLRIEELIAQSMQSKLAGAEAKEQKP
jgi:Rod binding domain-containing protein